MDFLDTVAPAADAELAAWRTSPGDPATLDHRALMARALAFVGAWVRHERTVDAGVDERTGGAAPAADDDLATAHGYVRQLAARQSPGGTFVGGDNVLSPPDSAFTVNDVCDALELLAPYRGSEPAAEALAGELDAIVGRATPALRSGGVHTPNHRWEIASALARIHRLHPSDDLVVRIEEWLAEGPDIDDDGLWSERSPNYAAAVSCPAFLVLAEVLDRPDLVDPVRRSLDATLALLLPDDSVETVQSRRQDQSRPFGIGPFAPLLWHVAVLDDRADLAAVAARAAVAPTWQPSVTAARAMTDPLLARPLPAGEPLPLGTRTFRDARLVHVREAGRDFVLFAGSDVPTQGHVRSGLANSPTFLRVHAGAVVLTDVRLSREFFGLGPFRPTTLETLGDGRFRLTEQVTAGYHQPLPVGSRRAGGDYALADEGRFSAAMSFASRPSDTVSLTTTVDVQLTPDAVELEVVTAGADVPWSLQLTFRAGGTLTGAGTDAVTGERIVDTEAATYRLGDDVVTVGPGTASSPEHPAFYAPGQDYDFLGGTDRPAGEHVHLTGRSPGRTRFAIRTVR